MPNIPEIQYGGVAQATVGPSATPETFGADMGRAMQDFGKTINETTKQVLDVYQEAAAAEATRKAQQEAAEYAQQLKYGGQDAEGNHTPPPDPSTHAELYAKKVDEIKGRMSTKLIGTASYSFERNFAQYSGNSRSRPTPSSR
jgi:hypothetical protein